MIQLANFMVKVKPKGRERIEFSRQKSHLVIGIIELTTSPYFLIVDDENRITYAPCLDCVYVGQPDGEKKIQIEEEYFEKNVKDTTDAAKPLSLNGHEIKNVRNKKAK